MTRLETHLRRHLEHRSETPALTLGRRGVLAAGFSLAGLALAAAPARALTTGEAPIFPDPVAVPERDGVLPWRRLSRFEDRGWGTPVKFAPDLQALDGQEVVIEGYMLPYDDAPMQRPFILAGYQTHCPFCVPGGMASIVEVWPDLPVPVSDSLVTMRGPLSLLEGDAYSLLFEIRNAVPVTG